jgi:antirestriction protein ArdC
MGKKTKKLLEKLEKGIEQVRSSEEFKEMLKFFSKFHNYSLNNQILIQLQKSGATHVAGYKKWQKLGRQVQKGEKGIKILAPMTFKKKVEEENENGEIVEKEKKVMYFRPVAVFDISQTDGDPIPRIDLSLKDKFGKIMQPLLKFADKRSIEVEFKTVEEDLILTNAYHGYSSGGYIAVKTTDRNKTEQASCLVHELAHELLHKENKEELTKEIKELEAEAVAFIVMDHYSVELKSSKYLALYKKSYDLKESMDRISRVSKEIINFTKDYLKNENQQEVKKTA